MLWPRFRCPSRRHPPPVAMRRLLLLVFAAAPAAAEMGYTHCACDGGGGAGAGGFWSLDNIFKWQKMMQGNIWAILDGQGLPESMTLVLRFQLQPSLSGSSLGGSFDLQYPSPSNQISGLKVLLIDDDDINLLVARKLLEKLGCTVSSLPSGSGFMNSVGPTSTSFQLVLVNLEMTAVNPLDVASRIRQYRSAHWPLVMAMTSERNVWEKCAQSGINGVLKKPLVLQEVKDELTRMIQNT